MFMSYDLLIYLLKLNPMHILIIEFQLKVVTQVLFTILKNDKNTSIGHFCVSEFLVI